MASPGSVVVQFVADSRKAVRGAADFAKSLGKVDDETTKADTGLRDVQRGLDKVGDAADQSTQDLRGVGTALDSTDFDQVAVEAEQTARRLRTAAGDMADGVRQGADGIDVETGRMRTNMGEVGREAGTEFIGNIAEGIGSGQANVTDVVQGTLGGITNLAASLGPVGAVAAGVAGGIGLVFSAMKGQAEAAKAKLDALRDALADIQDVASEAGKTAIFEAWLADAQKIPGKVAQIEAVIERAGITAEEFQGALAGNPEDLETVVRKSHAMGGEIIRAKQQTGQLTDEQQQYLDTYPQLLQDVDATTEGVAGIKAEHRGINGLLTDAQRETRGWKDDLDDVEGKAEDVNEELDHAARPRTVNFHITKKGQTMGEIIGSIPRTATAGQMAVQPVAINVYSSAAVPRTPRELVRMLEDHDMRMGRKPGTTRAVAW